MEEHIPEEEVYNIEKLVAKKEKKYLVKWENYPENQNTWEPRYTILKFILKYYEADLKDLVCQKRNQNQNKNKKCLIRK